MAEAGSCNKVCVCMAFGSFFLTFTSLSCGSRMRNPFEREDVQSNEKGTLSHEHGCGPNQWYHFGVGAPPILVGILVVGMFTDFAPWPYVEPTRGPHLAENRPNRGPKLLSARRVRRGPAAQPGGQASNEFWASRFPMGVTCSKPGIKLVDPEPCLKNLGGYPQLLVGIVPF